MAKRLFFDYAAQLQELHCVILYTVPITTLYAGGVGAAFGNPHIIPMINVYRYEPEKLELKHNLEGLNAIAAMVEKRVNSSAVFEQRDLLLKVAQASGGHVRHMMQMVRDAAIHALGLGYSKIKADNVVYAAKQLQFRFARNSSLKTRPSPNWPASRSKKNSLTTMWGESCCLARQCWNITAIIDGCILIRW